MGEDDAADPAVDVFLDHVVGFAVTLGGMEIADVLHDLTTRLSDLLGLAGAGVLLAEGGREVFVTSDLEAVTRLEEVQERDQRGPCVEASHSGLVVTIEDLDTRSRLWPRYVEQAKLSGMRSVACVPMRVGDLSIGGVDLYSDVPRRWSGTDIRVGQAFTSLATSYVVNAARLSHQQRMSAQLQQALDSRIVIEQAKGIIAAARDISVNEAFAILRKHANDHHATLRATAEAVVRLGLRP